MDDNKESMELIHTRLNLGKERYGHCVKVNNDTRIFGTEYNDWELMRLEEMVDGWVYLYNCYNN